LGVQDYEKRITTDMKEVYINQHTTFAPALPVSEGYMPTIEVVFFVSTKLRR